VQGGGSWGWELFPTGNGLGRMCQTTMVLGTAGFADRRAKRGVFQGWMVFPQKGGGETLLSPHPQTQLTTDIMPDQKTFVDQKAGGSRHWAGRTLPVVPILLLMLVV